ncbi:MAG TPA: glutathione S-transferase [Candidatus Binataceae bacterium]|nr:glutathione S-transferase [Candidatus Binataceae bacterium]
MLKAWGRRNSFNVQKVMWLIGELGLDHEHIDAGGSFGSLDTAEFRAMNPHGRVPVIDDGGTVVWESHSIVRYLCAKYGRGSLWRDDPAERSLADRWMDWSLATLQRDFMDLFWGFYRTPEAQRDQKTIDRLVAQCAEHYRLLDRHLAMQPFLAGDSLTMGDIPAGTSLYRYFELEIERPALPHVSAWYERLRERAPYRQHVMVPFDDLRGRLDY